MTDAQRIEGLANALNAVAQVAADAVTDCEQANTILDGEPAAACAEVGQAQAKLANIISGCAGAVETYGPA